jgi:hypothetical protein
MLKLTPSSLGDGSDLTRVSMKSGGRMASSGVEGVGVPSCAVVEGGVAMGDGTGSALGAPNVFEMVVGLDSNGFGCPNTLVGFADPNIEDGSEGAPAKGEVVAGAVKGEGLFGVAKGEAVVPEATAANGEEMPKVPLDRGTPE